MTDDEQELLNSIELINTELAEANVVLMAKLETARAEAMKECVAIAEQFKSVAEKFKAVAIGSESEYQRGRINSALQIAEAIEAKIQGSNREGE